MRRARIGGGMTTGALLGGAVVLLALPSAVMGFATRFDSDAATPARSADPTSDSAGLVPSGTLRSLARGPLFPFTPAGTPNRPDRSVTVAVRVDPETAREIAVRGQRLVRSEAPQAVPVRIASTAFNLGVSRGYQSFAQGLVATPAPTADGSAIVTGIDKGGDGTRLSPRIVLDDRTPLGRAPRTFAGEGKKLDLGGSYRVTGNLNVTTGVRYSQDRERLRPLTDGNSDNQAVYVGTQFRF